VRVLIVDDEQAARQRLVRLLADLDVEIAGEAADGLEALELAAKSRPDVVLLDIEMPEVSGLDVARRLPDPRPLIIFQTAFDQYALDAFEREALDYLLKPVTRERLAQAIAKAERRLAERATVTRVTAEMAARLEASLGRGGSHRPPRRLLVRHQAGHRLLAVSEVGRFVAAEGVVYAVAGQAQHLVDDSLDDLERRLATTFVRTSRSDLVAIDRVDRIVGNGDGSAMLVLKDGTEWRVSRRRTADVKRALER
jgi:DNA-binding LytR/AlgR family response regulator